ncbi:MAG: hypothetical protein M1294_02155 [Firmicutes bacterium]|jgi:hypothetical protein|nr:hypothetical protein [Bacillota bacterium]
MAISCASEKTSVAILSVWANGNRITTADAALDHRFYVKRPTIKIGEYRPIPWRYGNWRADALPSSAKVVDERDPWRRIN